MNAAAAEGSGLSLKDGDGVALGKNFARIHFIRAVMAIASGVAAGTLGLEFLYGFAFYFLCSLALSGALFLVVGSSRADYFPALSNVVWDGVTKNLFTFVLFWTIAYGTVHVY